MYCQKVLITFWSDEADTLGFLWEDHEMWTDIFEFEV
jgi:hypothetical protein